MKVRLTTLLLTFALSGVCAQAQTNQARVADAYGSVEKRLSPTDTRWQPVSIGDLLTPSSTVRTGANSAALLILPDKHAFRIGERGEVQLKELGQNRSYSFEVLKGQIWSFVDKARKPAKYGIETPSTVLGVSGRSENWTKKNESPKLNHQSEERIRNLKEQRKQRQQQQTQQDRKKQQKPQRPPRAPKRARAKTKVR